MKSYKLVESQDPEELASEVEGYLENGWVLIGAPFATVTKVNKESEESFYQAVGHELSWEDLEKLRDARAAIEADEQRAEQEIEDRDEQETGADRCPPRE